MPMHTTAAVSRSAKPSTRKAQRKAAAAAANDSAIFTRTAFGRLRVPPLPIRIAVGLAMLVAFPVIYLFRKFRTSKSVQRS